MFEEHDRVVLTDDICDTDLKAGDLGTIVHIYPNAEAFEVEFLALDGKHRSAGYSVAVPGAPGSPHGHHPCKRNQDNRLNGNNSL